MLEELIEKETLFKDKLILEIKCRSLTLEESLKGEG